MFGYYYNENIKKITIAFGALFSNIHVHHPMKDGSTEDILVPIHYSAQEKFVQRLLQPSSITEQQAPGNPALPGGAARIKQQLPILSYSITTITPDRSRAISRLNTLVNTESGGTCTNSGSGIKAMIPVDVAYQLGIYTRYANDMFQIVEQIMPYFVPEHIIKLNMNDVQQELQIPIVLAGNSWREIYDGEYAPNRTIRQTTMNFVAKSWIFAEVQSVTTIDETVSNIVFEDD